MPYFTTTTHMPPYQCELIKCASRCFLSKGSILHGSPRPLFFNLARPPNQQQQLLPSIPLSPCPSIHESSFTTWPDAPNFILTRRPCSRQPKDLCFKVRLKSSPPPQLLFRDSHSDAEWPQIMRFIQSLLLFITRSMAYLPIPHLMPAPFPSLLGLFVGAPC